MSSGQRPDDTATRPIEVVSCSHPGQPKPDAGERVVEAHEVVVAGYQQESDMSDGQKRDSSTAAPAMPPNSVRGDENIIEVEVPPYNVIDSSLWNEWRSRQLSQQRGKKIRLAKKNYLERQSFLQGCNLSEMDLSQLNLSGKDLSRADFSGSILEETDLTGTDLRGANLKRANLTGAKLAEARLSGAELDEETIFQRVDVTAGHVTVGINGIYVRRTNASGADESESAALMTLTPKGDSMKGNNADSVLENLQHARKLHTASILLSAVVTTLVCLKTDKFKLSALEGIDLSVGILSILSLLIAGIYELLVWTHLRDAADGATYLQSREDAMKIALFPWGLSSYPGERRPRPASTHRRRGRFGWLFLKWSSAYSWIREKIPPGLVKEAIRLVTGFHSVLYLLAGIMAYYHKQDRYGGWLLLKSPKSATYLILLLLLLTISLLVYLESRRFRRPIVFDMQTQQKSRNEIARLADAVTEQQQLTRRIANIMETAFPRYQNPQERFVDRLPDGVEIELRRISAGRFQMGSDEKDQDATTWEKPRHHVEIQEFWISPYTVTQELWISVMGRLPEELLNNRDYLNPAFPVVYVSWDEATSFCHRLNSLLGLSEAYGYRLPTEAEWEYVARAGSEDQYSFGNDRNLLTEYAWFAANCEVEVPDPASQQPGAKKKITRFHAVGQKKANALGIYDMHGNVWEWCQDHWHENYEGAPKDGRAWRTHDLAAGRVMRGGSWYRHAVNCRSADRDGNAPGSRYYDVGFRLSRTLPLAL
ncbi:MAG: SUMF1/EgtB/PvdO family nonheme iron enzyme [Acidobacteriota bacterium]